MSRTLTIIVFFVIVILASIGQVSDNKGVSSFCYTVAIILLADWVAFWS